MRVHLFDFPTALGIPVSEGESGPAVLRRGGLLLALRQHLPVRNLGEVAVERGCPGDGVKRRLRRVLAAAERQAGLFARSFTATALPITLGGDHSTSLGTALALWRRGWTFDVVWIDAHADFGSPEPDAPFPPAPLVDDLFGWANAGRNHLS